jgi:ADP-heptose:LPS heptosyltransferase
MKIVHTGHIGDIIAFLPLYKAIGGTKLYVRDDPGMAPMRGFKYDTMEPLLKHLGIDVEFNPAPQVVDVDMVHWRGHYRHDISLTDSQARSMGLIDPNIGHFEISSPWIDVEPDPLTKGRVIFNRTPRYRNPKFPWSYLSMHFNDRALFIGTDEEHELYEKEVGKPIERYPTPDCLAVARAIKGSDYFVGNQSSAFWIAAAMFHPLLQETDPGCPNSIIQFPRATYCIDGNIDFASL